MCLFGVENNIEKNVVSKREIFLSLYLTCKNYRPLPVKVYSHDN